MSSVTVPGSTTEDDRGRRPIVSRLAGLASALEGTRRGSSLDVRRLMLATGSTCMGLGLVAIVLGWYGAAHSSYLFQEIPYLISGGLLGVALVAGGGFLFFASWFVRMIENNHQYATRVERTLERVDHVLGAITDDAAFWGETHASNEPGGAGGTADDCGAADAASGPPPMGSYREQTSDPDPGSARRHPGNGSE
jgi:hypothetical protein